AQVRVFVARVIAPHAAGEAREWLAQHQRTELIGFGDGAVLAQDARDITRQRMAATARARGRSTDHRARPRSASLRLTISIVDEDLTATHDVARPMPGVWIERLAHQGDQLQARQIATFEQRIARTPQHA